MIDDIQKLSQHFLEIYNRTYQRYFLQENTPKHRGIILLGQRGVGKTTTIIQYLLRHVGGVIGDPRILYVPADHILIDGTSLYEIAESFQKIGGELIAFDEIHKYSSWSRELKSIYDTFPKLKILASGSSALEIHKGSHDLSRRIIECHLHGLSFREYIELEGGVKFEKIEFKEIIDNHASIARDIVKCLDDKNKKILVLFKSYLAGGYYPYFIDIPDVETYWITLEQNIRATIESDLTAIYPKLTGDSIRKLKQLLAFIAKSVPFTPSWASIKKIISVSDDRTIKHYFRYLEDAELIKSITNHSNKLRKLETEEKIYLNNPNQIQALASGNGNAGNIRETFIINMLSTEHEVTLPARGDFLINNRFTLEVGGRKKGFEQIKDLKQAYLACDDIEIGINQKIPLWLFGFLY